MDHVLTIQTIPSASLSDADRRQIITLCNCAYKEDSEDLFSTFVSPTHVLGRFDGHLVSHALWVTRYLQAGHGPLLRTAYVEAVATDPDYQRRGFATAVMQRLAAEVQDFELAALSPSDPAFYARLGWQLWRGPLFIRTEDGLLASADEEQVMILRLPRTPLLDLDMPLSAEWRQGELW